MENSKLVQLLRTLDATELKAFDRYVTQRYSEHEPAKALFEHICSFAPGYKDDRLNKSYILKTVLKLPEDNNKRIGNEASKLFGWLEDFLLLQMLNDKRNSIQREKLMLRIYKERHATNLFSLQVEGLKKKIIEQSNDQWHCLHLLEIIHECYYQFDTSQKYDNKEMALENIDVLLSKFYQLSKVKYDCEIKSRNRILQKPKTTSKKNAEPLYNYEVVQPLIEIYEAMKLMINDDKNAYFNVKELFNKKNEIFSYEDRKIFLAYLINYTGRAIRVFPKESKHWFKEAYELYEYGIENKLYSLEKEITENTLHNMVNIACELEQLEWGEKALAAYMKTKGISDSTLIAEARFLFEKGEYQLIIEKLNAAAIKTESGELQKRVLEVRSLFELKNLDDKYFDKYTNAVGAFEVYLYRHNKLNQENKKSYINFLKILKEIDSNKLLSKQQLLKKIENVSEVIAKSWLEKIVNRKSK